MDTSDCNEQPRNEEDNARRKELKEEEVRSGNLSTHSV
jgi:hypothetical protein